MKEYVSSDAYLIDGVQPHFVDFGAGTGGSMRIGEQFARGPGIGIERDLARVQAATSVGLAVVQADALEFQVRGLAAAAICFDMIPELAGRKQFEMTLINMLRTARDFAVIQHLCFDTSDTLIASGRISHAYFERNINIQPRLVDYLHFYHVYKEKLNLTGLSAYGVGHPKVDELPPAGARGQFLDSLRSRALYRSVRVIFGRRQIERFEGGLRRAGVGDMVLICDQ
ncbi:MAG: hypothetical protein K5Q68_05150 [Roseococcus sp.]|nr:hypothetical protein [Roseococcus sp.]